MLINTLREKAAKNISYSGFNTYINPFSYLMLRGCSSYIKSFDNVYFDGSLAAYIFSFLFKEKFSRRSFDFTSVAGPVFEHIQNNNFRLAIVGSTKVSVELFVLKIKEMYPRINIVYFRDGYFRKEDYELVYSDINTSNPDFLLIGMGTPNQECFLAGFRGGGNCKNAFTCGGFIHQTASTTDGKYYPEFYNKYNLRWLFRMIDEPKLIKRYFLSYPTALFFIISDFIFSFAKKTR